MADGALERFDADTAVAITGIAGPGRRHRGEAGGLRLLLREARRRLELARDIQLPGDRADIRDRSTTVAMHLLRRLLRGEELPSGVSRERPGQPRTRLFVALDLPEAAREALAAWRDGALGGPRRPAPGAGRAPARDARVPRLAGRGDVERIAATAFEPLAGLGAGARSRRRGLVPVPARGAAPVRARPGGRGRARVGRFRPPWRALAGRALYEPEQRPFWPHVTLARVKRGRRAPRLPRRRSAARSRSSRRRSRSTARRSARRARSTSRWRARTLSA